VLSGGGGLDEVRVVYIAGAPVKFEFLLTTGAAGGAGAGEPVAGLVRSADARAPPALRLSTSAAHLVSHLAFTTGFSNVPPAIGFAARAESSAGSPLLTRDAFAALLAKALRPPVGADRRVHPADALTNARVLGRLFDALDFSAVGQVEWRDAVVALSLFSGVGDKSDKLCYLFEMYAPQGGGGGEAFSALPRHALWRLLRALLAALAAVGEVGAELDIADAVLVQAGETGVHWVDAGRLPPGVRACLATRADRAAEVSAAADAFAALVFAGGPPGATRVTLDALVAAYNGGGSAHLNFLELLSLKKWSGAGGAATASDAAAMREDMRDVLCFALTRDVRGAAAQSEAEAEAEAEEAAEDAADADAVAEADAAAAAEAEAAYEAAMGGGEHGAPAPAPPDRDAGVFDFNFPRASTDASLNLSLKARDCSALERVLLALPPLDLAMLGAFVESCAVRDPATGGLVVAAARFPNIIGALVIDQEDGDCVLSAGDIKAAEVCLLALLSAFVPYGSNAAPLPELSLALSLLAFSHSKSEKLQAAWALFDSRGGGALTLPETHRLFGALLTALFTITLWDELAFLVLEADLEGAAVRAAAAPLSRADAARVRDAAAALGDGAYGGAVEGAEAEGGLTFDAFGRLYTALVAAGEAGAIGVSPRGAPDATPDGSPWEGALRPTDYHVLELLDLRKWPLFDAAALSPDEEAAAEAAAAAEEAEEDAEALREADAADEAEDEAELAADIAEAEAEAEAEEAALEAEEAALDAAEAAFWDRVRAGEAAPGANAGDGEEDGEAPAEESPTVAQLEARATGAARAAPRVDAATSVSSSSLGGGGSGGGVFDPSSRVFVYPLHRGVRLVITAEDVLAARAQHAVSPLSKLLSSDLLSLLVPRASPTGMLPRSAYLRVVHGVVDAAADAYVERTGGSEEPLGEADVERFRSAIYTARAHGDVLLRMFALLQEDEADASVDSAGSGVSAGGGGEPSVDLLLLLPALSLLTSGSKSEKLTVAWTLHASADGRLTQDGLAELLAAFLLGLFCLTTAGQSAPLSAVKDAVVRASSEAAGLVFSALGLPSSPGAADDEEPEISFAEFVDAYNAMFAHAAEGAVLSPLAWVEMLDGGKWQLPDDVKALYWAEMRASVGGSADAGTAASASADTTLDSVNLSPEPVADDVEGGVYPAHETSHDSAHAPAGTAPVVALRRAAPAPPQPPPPAPPRRAAAHRYKLTSDGAVLTLTPSDCAAFSYFAAASRLDGVAVEEAIAAVGRLCGALGPASRLPPRALVALLRPLAAASTSQRPAVRPEDGGLDVEEVFSHVAAAFVGPDGVSCSALELAACLALLCGGAARKSEKLYLIWRAYSFAHAGGRDAPTLPLPWDGFVSLVRAVVLSVAIFGHLDAAAAPARRLYVVATECADEVARVVQAYLRLRSERWEGDLAAGIAALVREARYANDGAGAVPTVTFEGFAAFYNAFGWRACAFLELLDHGKRRPLPTPWCSPSRCRPRDAHFSSPRRT